MTPEEKLVFPPDAETFVPQPARPSGLVPYGAWTGNSVAKGMVITTLDASTPEGRKQLYRAQSGQDMTAQSQGQKEFYVQDFTLHLIEIEDPDSGEIHPTVRCCLTGPDGYRVSCCSEGVVTALQAMARSFGPPPWKPAMLVRIVEMLSRRGRRYYTLDVL